MLGVPLTHGQPGISQDPSDGEQIVSAGHADSVCFDGAALTCSAATNAEPSALHSAWATAILATRKVNHCVGVRLPSTYPAFRRIVARRSVLTTETAVDRCAGKPSDAREQSYEPCLELPTVASRIIARVTTQTSQLRNRSLPMVYQLLRISLSQRPHSRHRGSCLSGA